MTHATEKKENYRLIIIGDSLIQGYGLPKEKGFVNQLQKKVLEKMDNISFINAGVSGCLLYTSPSPRDRG